MPFHRCRGSGGSFDGASDPESPSPREGRPDSAEPPTLPVDEAVGAAFRGADDVEGDRPEIPGSAAEGDASTVGAFADEGTALVEPPRARSDDEARTGGLEVSDGDASIHLEELLTGPLPPLPGLPREVPAVAVELVGPHLRLSGGLRIGTHRRLSDFVNHHLGLFELVDATVLRRNGEPTRVHAPSFWVLAEEVTLIAQRAGEPRGDPAPAPELHVPKLARSIVVVTPGHTLTGNVFITEGAELATFLESPTPQFVPMTDVRTRSLADRRILARYPFALLNRRHMVAATELQPGMTPGKVVL